MPALKRCTVVYRDAEDSAHKQRLIPKRKAAGVYVAHDNHAQITVTFDGEVFDVKLQALRDIRVTECTIEAAHRFASSGRVLMNGYQSWTDTHETDIRAFRHGLRGLPRHLINHFLLDAAGDYRFVDYGFARGRMHGWTYATMRRGGSVFLIGSLNEDDGFTLIRFDTGQQLINVEKECPNRIIRAGETLHLCRIAAIMRGRANDEARTLTGMPQAEAEAFDRWFQLMGVRRLPARPMVGYSSWYRHFNSINEQNIGEDLDATAAVMRAVNARGAQRVFEIDDGYAKVGDWVEPYEAKFPHGLKPLVKRIEAAGFTPGLWMAPFACERDSDTFMQHPDWILRNHAGEPVQTGTHWGGAFALDTLNPAVRAFVTRVIHTFTRDWGFKLLKVDFLYAACMEPHGGMNRGELMADAMQLLRDAAGPDVQLLGCGVPLASAFGRVEYCRIGCDVGLDWNNRFYYSILSRERVSTKRSLENTVGRAPLNGRAFLNDPDIFFLRDDVDMSRGQKDLLLTGDACFASALLTSDNMRTWTLGDVERFQRAIDLMCAANAALPEAGAGGGEPVPERAATRKAAVQSGEMPVSGSDGKPDSSGGEAPRW